MIDGLIILVIFAYFINKPHLLTSNHIDQLIFGKEENGKIRWLILLSCGLMFIAALYCLPSIKCHHLGNNYMDLASNPFAFDSNNPVAFRILTPLISYCIGLRGQGIIITNILITIAMIGIIYHYFRSITQKPNEGLFAALVITFSMVVLSTLHNGGYCDILTYVIIFYMWRFQKQRTLFYLLFFLGLLNRESIAFLIPWFMFISLENSKSKMKILFELIIGFAIVFALYYFYREWISSMTDVSFSTNYYLEPILKDPFGIIRGTISNHGIGLFSVFKLFWVIPILYICFQYKEKNFKKVFEIFLIIFCCYLQLIIAYDTTRMFTQAFMVMIISLKWFYESDFRYLKENKFWLIGICLLVPQVNTAANIVEIWNSSFLYLIESLLRIIAKT